MYRWWIYWLLLSLLIFFCYPFISQSDPIINNESIITLSSNRNALFQKPQGPIAVFLIGDSTSNLLYIDGLMSTFNCQYGDPEAKQVLEKYGHPSMFIEWAAYLSNPSSPKITGGICKSPLVSRVGFKFAWGAALKCCNYHKNWETHRSFNDSVDNFENIKIGLQEFNHRSRNDAGKIILLNMVYWDSAYYSVDEEAKYPTLNQWLLDYNRNYSTIVETILQQINPHTDRLILHMNHFAKPGWIVTYYGYYLLFEIIKIAEKYQLPIYRQDIVAGIYSPSTNNYLKDNLHPIKALCEKAARGIKKMIENPQFSDFSNVN